MHSIRLNDTVVVLSDVLRPPRCGTEYFLDCYVVAETT